MKKATIELFRPSIKRKDLEYVLTSLIEDRLDYGDFSKRFEDKLSERAGVNEVIAIDSFQLALSLILDCFGVSEGDEVILPSFMPQVFLSVILQRKAVPVLVDLEEGAYIPSLDGVRMAVTDKTKLLFLYYYFGYTYDPTPYIDIFPDVVQDITSVLGAKVNGLNVGSLGTYSIADFSRRSIIANGEGAAIFCPKKISAGKIKKFIESDELPDEYFPRYRSLMSDIKAAMGISQEETLNHRLALCEKIGKIYEESVKRSNNYFITHDETCERLYSDFPVILRSSGLKEAREYFRKNGVVCDRPFPFALHHAYKSDSERFPNTEYMFLKTILVPIYANLLTKDVDLIGKILASMM